DMRVAYFPTRTGRLVIGPTRAHVRIVRRVASQDPWSMLGIPDTQIEEGVIQTDRAVLDVQPLPSGAPSSFKGAVGSYTMQVKVDRATVRAGEPVTVITSVKGEGNIGSAGDPDVFASVPARSYTASPSTSLDRAGEHLRGERRREMTFVPEAPGRFAILPVRYSWFDPDAQRYRTQMSDSIRITVFPSDAPGDSLRPARVTGPVAALRSEPGTRGYLTLEPSAASRTVAVVSLLATVVALVGRRVRAGIERDPRRRRIAGIDALLAELGAVQGGGGDAAPAAIRIASIVRRALGLRYVIDVEGHPADDALARAKAAGAAEGDLEDASKLFDALDQLAFAPPDARAGIIQSEREAAERLLKRCREGIS
ncbi:MAG: BatD family protein, partial [Candidatus Eiseniibacteriota bacterium]